MRLRSHSRAHACRRLALQFANATVGFVEENNAGNAIDALKRQLAPSCHVCRDGE
jgi:H+-transporting ATPase